MKAYYIRSSPSSAHANTVSGSNSYHINTNTHTQAQGMNINTPIIYHISSHVHVHGGVLPHTHVGADAGVHYKHPRRYENRQTDAQWSGLYNRHRALVLPVCVFLWDFSPGEISGEWIGSKKRDYAHSFANILMYVNGSLHSL